MTLHKYGAHFALALTALSCFSIVALADDSSFTINLQRGESGPQVQLLQIFLNTHGYMLAQTGPGSPGMETSYFGFELQSSLERFQKANGLPSTGYFGPLTRTLVNSMLRNGTSTTTTVTAGVAVSSDLTASSSAATSTTQNPDWLAFFNSHAPPPGWIPGFGGGGKPSSQPSQRDTTPPTVSIIAPAAGTTTLGIVTLTASASDNVGISNVQFLIDGVATGTPLTSAPYTYNWNSIYVADGSHTVSAAAEDAAGNVATSTGVVITIQNDGPVISNIRASGVTDSQATITWTTDQASDSRVYSGYTVGSYIWTQYDPALVTSHTIILTYYCEFQDSYPYIVVSTNALGVTSTSSVQTFNPDACFG